MTASARPIRLRRCARFGPCHEPRRRPPRTRSRRHGGGSFRLQHRQGPRRPAERGGDAPPPRLAYAPERQGLRVMSFHFFLARTADDNPMEFATAQDCAALIQSGEIDPDSVLEISDDVPPRDVSEDVARIAWAQLSADYEDGDRVPNFIETHIPDFDHWIGEIVANRADDAAHVRRAYR